MQRVVWWFNGTRLDSWRILTGWHGLCHGFWFAWSGVVLKATAGQSGCRQDVQREKRKEREEERDRDRN